MNLPLLCLLYLLFCNITTGYVITVKTHRGNLNLDVGSWLSIAELKLLVDTKLGIPKDRQIVWYRNRVVADMSSLSNLGITEGESLFIRDGGISSRRGSVSKRDVQSKPADILLPSIREGGNLVNSRKEDSRESSPNEITIKQQLLQITPTSIAGERGLQEVTGATGATGPPGKPGICITHPQTHIISFSSGLVHIDHAAPDVLYAFNLGNGQTTNPYYTESQLLNDQLLQSEYSWICPSNGTISNLHLIIAINTTLGNNTGQLALEWILMRSPSPTTNTIVSIDDYQFMDTNLTTGVYFISVPNVTHLLHINSNSIETCKEGDRIILQSRYAYVLTTTISDMFISITSSIKFTSIEI